MDPRTEGHAFISYVREDVAHVDRLQRILQAAGIRVWRDTEDLWPGQDWRLEIKRAINENSLIFLACISDNSNAKETSYQNLELVLAAEQMRSRLPGKQWLIPVRFSDCVVPDYDLGAGRSLKDLQRVDLFDELWDTGSPRLVAAALEILKNRSPMVNLHVPTPPKATAPVSNVAHLKSVLLEPNRQIELEDLVVGVLGEVRQRLVGDEFPVDSPSLTSGIEGARYLVSQARQYEAAVTPLLELLIAGCTWGREEHEPLWARVMQGIANADRRRTGKTALIHLQSYPLVVLTYGASLAASIRQNFGALRAVAVDPKRRNETGSFPVVNFISPMDSFSESELAANILAFEDDETINVDDEFVNKLIQRRRGKRYTPISDHLSVLLRSHFAASLADEDEYIEEFDRLEVLLALLATDSRIRAKLKGQFVRGGWYGSFTWRHRYAENPIEQRMQDEFQEQQQAWAPLKGRLFGGAPDRASEAFRMYTPDAAQVRRQRY
ncbi:toll/interleukin-1 receptor domain-containing protein [Dactylosporangium sp. NPDC006015]|uniref:toll/interleukin-1 receptor domain-containing protein n=1 Tax=Dactylosporangium sp. NPDC006015 TaxID=3154576 RepID=UPI0033A17DCC